MPAWPRVVPFVDALVFQRNSCADLGSNLYAEVLDAVIADVGADGPCAAILRPHEGEPFGSALPLRFLGSVHRLVLQGRAPRLAAHYPSAGGTPGPSLADDFVATVAELRPEIEARIGNGVQTNEVGRSAALVGGFVEVARRSGLPLRLLELGASAGLNLRWDRFWYDTGGSTFGDPTSAVRFVGVWDDPPPVLDDVAVAVAEREGCDRSPIDPIERGRAPQLAGLPVARHGRPPRPASMPRSPSPPGCRRGSRPPIWVSGSRPGWRRRRPGGPRSCTTPSCGNTSTASRGTACGRRSGRPAGAPATTPHWRGCGWSRPVRWPTCG